jgi:nitrate/nitrite-specific signal transduction histidine kinase
MKVAWKNFSIIFIWIASFLGTAGALEIGSSAEAINIAGKQRMLSYRILKDYLMVSMESTYKNPKEDLAKAMRDFEEAQKALVLYSKDQQVQTLTKEVEDAFNVIQKMVSQPFDSSREEEYLQKATHMKELSHGIVLRLQTLSGAKSAEIVNKSGRLRAVSQRMNALYLLKTLGVSSSVIQNGMKASMKIFRDNLDFLQKSEPKDADIVKRLKKLEKIHLFFQIMLESDNHVPTIITKKSGKMLKYGDELTNIYVEKSK